MVVVAGQAIVVDHQAVGRRAGSVGIAVRRISRRVDLRQKGRDRLRHAVGTAESPHQPRLFPWVLERRSVPLVGSWQRRRLFRVRPLARIAPIVVARQHLRTHHKRPLVDHKSRVVIHIPRRRRPEHQSLRLVRRWVKPFNANIRLKPPRDRRVFLRRYRPRQRQDDAQTRRIRRVAVGRVNNVKIRQRALDLRQRLLERDSHLVQIQRDQRAALHLALRAARALERSPHIAANVLAGAALGFVHRSVFRHPLRRAARIRQLVDEFRQRPLLALPNLRAHTSADRQRVGFVQMIGHRRHSFFMRKSRVTGLWLVMRIVLSLVRSNALSKYSTRFYARVSIFISLFYHRHSFNVKHLSPIFKAHGL